MGLRSWIGKKVVMPFVLKVGSSYLEHAFLTAKKRFRKKERDLSSHERKTLAMLRAVGVRPASNWDTTQRSLTDMTGSISELLLRDPDADQRPFGINFLSYYTDEMTLQEMITSLRTIEVRTLSSIVKAVSRELADDPAVRLISTRDALGGILQATEDECRACFRDTQKLHEYLGQRDDLNGWQTGPTGADPVEYGGVDSPIMVGTQEFREMRNAQLAMKDVGRQTGRQKCSRTHIVMSVALGDGWATQNSREKKWMVISAGKTDKTTLLVPSQTPIVQKEHGKWIYYGDPGAPPSSELASHWVMHEILGQANGFWRDCRSIFHEDVPVVVEK